MSSTQTAIEQVDIAIVGGGPAGAAALLGLQHFAGTVALIEKAQFPKEKACGDAIPGQAFRLLQTLLPSFEAECAALASAAPSGGGMVYGAFGAQARVQFARPSWVIKRAEFDNLLLQKAKTACPCSHLQEELRTIVRAEGSAGQPGFLLTFRSGAQLWACIVLAADGAHSVVRKSLHHDGKAAQEAESIAIRAYAKAGKTGTQPERTLHLWFAKNVQPGYIWLFPVGSDGYNIGIGIVGKVPPGQSLRRMLKEALADPNNPIGTNWELDESTWLGHPVPLGKARSPVSGSGYMLLGDAAHLVAPATGEGIGHAILSGLIAADAAIASLANKEMTAAQMAELYDIPLLQKLDPLFARQRRLLWFGGTFPRLFNALIGLASRNSFLRQKLASL